MAQHDELIRVKVPGRFIEDCYECCCDVGDYERGKLVATPAQLAELVSRAKHYAHGGTDASERGFADGAVRWVKFACDAWQADIRAARAQASLLIVNGIPAQRKVIAL